MNITYHDYRSATPSVCSVAEFVTSTLKDHGDYYRNGVAEDAASHARRNSEAIGKLVEILASKGMLYVDQVVEIAGSYHGMDKVQPRFVP